MSGLFGVVDLAAPRVEPEGFRRLAERPLFDPQSRVCVLLDGRLDNRPELIARLSPARGPEASDSEILLAAYLEWGEACTDRLLGDFAFAIWDAGRRRLLCAVDPLGIKPLHYAQVGSLICFASDAIQVLQHPAVPDGYDEAEIAAYLAGCCEDPERSFFAAVHKLGPGRRLIAENGGLRAERYWSPSTKEIRYSRDEDYADRFRELLQQAVADRTRGAGSFVGVAMSGGLDSTSVAALAQRAPGPGVRAYTFVFDHLTGCDERAYSRAMTEELGLEVEPVEAERFWSLESQTDVPSSPDTPFFGWRTCYQEIFHRMARQGARVLLMGHGGDDLLRGSSLIYAERLRGGDLSAVREVVRHTRSRQESLPRALYRHFVRPHLPAGVDQALVSMLGKREEPPPAWIHPDFVRRTRFAGDLRRSFARTARQGTYSHLIETPWYWRLANWYDRSAAAFGIEVRHPFLDRRLFEYVLAIPGEQLFRLGRAKSLLRGAMAGILPERIRQRVGKTRFSPFLDFALRERAADEIRDILFKQPLAAELGILDGRILRSAFLDFLGNTSSASRGLWYAIMLEIWLRRCAVIREGCQRVKQEHRAA